MGIYHPRVEQDLLTCETEHNILYDYDNYTYKIKLFMVPNDVLQKYEKGMAEGDNSVYTQLLMSTKYVIAESGVTNSTWIESLEMDTVPPTNIDNNSITTIKMDLRLEEVGGNSLVNKIALCSKLCGYDSYVLQKYFILIDFMGYRHNQLQAREIESCIGGQHYLYEVTLANVKTVMESNKTSYLIEMYPQYFSSLSADFNRLTMCGKFALSTHDRVESSMNVLSRELNKQLKKLLGDKIYKHIYGSTDAYYIKVKYFYDKSINIYDSDERKKEKDKIENMTNIFLDKEVNSEKYQNLAEAHGVEYGTYNGQLQQIIITPSEEDTVQTIIKKIIFLFPELAENGYGHVIENRDVFVKSYLGVNWYQHYIYVNIIPVPGLRNSYKAARDDTYDDYINRPIAMQEDYLGRVIRTGQLKKRYYWLHNDKNIDVLSIKRNEDELWYLNCGMASKININDNSTGDTNQLTISDPNPNVNNDDFLKALNLLKRTRTSINVDDVYMLYRKNKSNYYIDGMFGLGISSSLLDLYQNDSVAENTNTAEKQKNDKDIKIQTQNNIANLGYVNLFKSGNKLDIDMDIIGDPYWLLYGSESIRLGNLPFMLPHMVVCMKSFVMPDGFDDYGEDPLMSINTLYSVTEIKSIFQNGTFTQKLKGFVALPFMKSSIASSDSAERKYESRNGSSWNALPEKKEDNYTMEDHMKLTDGFNKFMFSPSYGGEAGNALGKLMNAREKAGK